MLKRRRPPPSFTSCICKCLSCPSPRLPTFLLLSLHSFSLPFLRAILLSFTSFSHHRPKKQKKQQKRQTPQQRTSNQRQETQNEKKRQKVFHPNQPCISIQVNISSPSSSRITRKYLAACLPIKIDSSVLPLLKGERNPPTPYRGFI